MAISTLARLLAGIGVFVLLARSLGPAGFGEFAFWLTVGGMIALPVSYGFNQYVLREIAQQPANAAEIAANVLACKLLLTLAVAVASACVAPLAIPLNLQLFATTVAIGLADSFSEYWFALRRVLGSYRAEAVLVTLHSVGHVALFLACLQPGYTALDSACLFLMSRVILLILAGVASGLMLPVSVSRKSDSILRTFAAGAPYAIDTSVGSVYAQIDVILARIWLGLEGAGIFAAAIRFYQASLQVASVLANVFLPRLSACFASNKPRFPALAAGVMSCFAGAGLASFAVLSIAAEPISQTFFGHAYATLPTLLPWVGAFIAARFVLGGLGLVLSAAGRQWSRSIVTLITLAVFVSAAWVATNASGLRGMMLGHLAAVAVGLVMYGRWALNLIRTLRTAQ